MKYRKLLLFLCVLCIFRCEEKLPNWEQPSDLVIGVIQPYTVRSAICASNREPREPLTINIGVVNNYDETLQGTKYIKLKLTIWLRYYPEVKRSITFESINPNDLITIDPGATHWIRLQWDHKDDNGRMMYESFPEITKYGYHIEFKAIGTIQIYQNVQSVATDETEFSVQYYLEEKC